MEFAEGMARVRTPAPQAQLSGGDPKNKANVGPHYLLKRARVSQPRVPRRTPPMDQLPQVQAILSLRGFFALI